MASILKSLSKEAIQAEQKDPALLPTEKTLKALQPDLSGLKMTLSAMSGVAVVSLMAVTVLGVLWNQERITVRNQQSLLEARTTDLLDASGMQSTAIERMQDQWLAAEQVRERVNQELERNAIDLSNLQKRMKIMQDRAATMEKQITRLIADQVRAPAGAVIPVTSVTPVTFAGEASPAVKEEQVLTVNEEFNFIVVNIGLRDGVKIGDQLVVWRKEKAVGRVQVEKLYDSFAAATILETTKKMRIQEGDSIRRAE